jgi:hypothetical protein
MRFTAKVVLAILILLCSGGPNGRSAESAQLGIYKSSPFRYVIVHNEVAKTYQIRQVWVLMEEKAFTEDNLRVLYQLVVKRYPEPSSMDVTVLSNLEDVATPEEADNAIGYSEEKNPPKYSGAPNAVFVRHSYAEFINYFNVGPNHNEHGHIAIREPKQE